MYSAHQSPFAHHGVFGVSLHGNAPFAIPCVHETAVANTFFGSRVDTKYIPLAGSTPNSAVSRKQCRCPGIPGLGITRLSVHPRYESGAPFITLRQAAVAEVFRDAGAIVVARCLLDADLAQIGFSEDYRSAKSTATAPQNKET